MPGGAGGVIRSEVNLATRVPSFAGVYVAAAFPAVKGDTNEPFLVSSEGQFLKKCTPEGKIEPGMDLGYFSVLAALQRSDKVWISRAVGANAKYAGLALATLASATANAAWDAGETDPEGYTFGSDENLILYGANIGAWPNAKIGVKVWIHRTKESVNAATGVDISTDRITVTQKWVTGEPVQLYISTGEGDALPTGLSAGVVYYVIAVDGTHFKLASSLANAKAGTAINITGAGQGTMSVYAYNDVPESNAFKVEVYQSTNENVPVESFTCSRVEGAKDGYGRNMYLEDRLQASEYIRGFSNAVITDTTLPKPVTEILYLAAGDDGSAVTDGGMITAINKFANPLDKPVTVFIDCGWATPAYHSQLATLAATRGDSVAFISVPYEKEASADYLNDIVDYRKNILGLGGEIGSFVGLYSPHVKIYDRWNDRYLYVAPDGYAAAALSYTAYNYEMWYPVAGYKRGSLSVLDLRRRFTKAEMDVLYDAGVNPCRFAPGKGIAIWGQKTLYGAPSALDRLNTRLMLIVIEPAVSEALESFLWELNTPSQRSIAKNLVDGYMEGIKARQGVYDFYTQCDSDNNTDGDIDNHIMNLDLFVKPTSSLEYIPFRTVITSTGMNFKLAASAV